jgi:CRP-like cAMP-binding protein
MHSSHGPAARLLTKLQSIATLSQADKEAVLALPIRVQTVKADQELVREGDKPTQSILLLDGFMCRYKFTETGKRQIFAFHTPGDMPDVLTLHLKTMDHSVGTISRCEVGFVQHDTLRALFEVRPGLMDVFWRDTLVDAAIFRDVHAAEGGRS